MKRKENSKGRKGKRERQLERGKINKKHVRIETAKNMHL
jgi:hypothetical protein